jgi:hypothetical protein
VWSNLEMKDRAVAILPITVAALLQKGCMVGEISLWSGHPGLPYRSLVWEEKRVWGTDGYFLHPLSLE